MMGVDRPHLRVTWMILKKIRFWITHDVISREGRFILRSMQWFLRASKVRRTNCRCIQRERRFHPILGNVQFPRKKGRTRVRKHSRYKRGDCSRRLLDKSPDDPPTPRPNFISSLYPYLRASLFRLSTHKSRFLAGPASPRDNSALASSLTASRLAL